MNRSQADINKSVDMMAARRREREYFANSPEYKHLAHRMGSEHLGKMLSKVPQCVSSSSDRKTTDDNCMFYLILVIIAVYSYTNLL